MMKFSPYFDPDEIVITKPILRKISNAVITRWKKNHSANFAQIKALEAFRFSLRFQSDDAINEIFRSIIRTVNEMQQINAMLKMKNEQPRAEALADLAIKKILEKKI